jgi:hypothetical protein
MTAAGMWMAPWTGFKQLPILISKTESLVVQHDITYEAIDDNPGVPEDIYAHHSLIYDLFLFDASTPWEWCGQFVPTDEIIIMTNYNADYPDCETFRCADGMVGNVMSEPIEAKAVFNGTYWYDYHSMTDKDTPAPGVNCNYHNFRRIGGDVPGAPVPKETDLMLFFNYLQRFYNTGDKQFPMFMMVTNLYDYTHGSVTLHGIPTFEIIKKENAKEK